MAWNIRSAIATGLWIAAGLLTLFFLFSGWWIFAPFAFASGSGGQVLGLLLSIIVLAGAAHLIGRSSRRG
jgi:hypothetical protein